MNLSGFLLSVLSALALAQGFTMPQSGSARSTALFAVKKSSGKKTGSSMKVPKWLDDMINQPMHGHGSGETELDDIYQAQQKILEDRRAAGDLHQKYKQPGVSHLDEIKTIQHDPKTLNQAEDDAMYVDESAPAFNFKFPWDNKLKP